MRNLTHANRATFAGSFVLFLACSTACAQSGPTASSTSSSSEVSNGTLAHHEIKPSDLPPPKLENEVNNGPNVISRPAGAKLNLPPGFEVGTFAEGGFERPRWMALAPNGDVFLADSSASGKIIVLRDTNHDGVVLLSRKISCSHSVSRSGKTISTSATRTPSCAFITSRVRRRRMAQPRRSPIFRDAVIANTGLGTFYSVVMVGRCTSRLDRSRTSASKPMKCARQLSSSILTAQANVSLPAEQGIRSAWPGCRAREPFGPRCRNAIAWETIYRRTM